MKESAEVVPFTVKGTLYYLLSSQTRTEKIAAFDLDSTLIRTKSGAKFAKDAEDWQPQYENVPQILADLVANGYTLVVFTNQKGTGRKNPKPSPSHFAAKIAAIKAEWNVDFDVFAATGGDYYRKPCTHMWQEFCELTGTTADLETSFYCGDAAGRSFDFSASDRHFAYNVGIPFRLPEEVFEQHMEDWEVDDYIYTFQHLEVKPSEGQEIVLMVGPPASGKSTLAAEFVSFGYTRINQDTLKTKKKCLKAAEKALATGQSIVVDNTNPRRELRDQYRALAPPGTNISVRIYWFNYEDPHNTEYLNYFRCEKRRVKLIPAVAYATFRKYLEPPTPEECGENGELVEIHHFIDNPVQKEKMVAFHA